MDMKDLDKKIEETMHALNGISKAEPRPFFYTRLQARMDNERSSLPVKALRPALVFPAALLSLFLTAFSIYTVSSQNANQNSKEVFAKEYGLSESLYTY